MTARKRERAAKTFIVVLKSGHGPANLPRTIESAHRWLAARSALANVAAAFTIVRSQLSGSAAPATPRKETSTAVAKPTKYRRPRGSVASSFRRVIERRRRASRSRRIDIGDPPKRLDGRNRHTTIDSNIMRRFIEGDLRAN